MSLMPGSCLGPYEILSALGAGGMGEVYRARDTKLNRDVALKILPEAFTLDGDRIARFRREAQVLAALNHPNIAAIYGFEDSGSTHALVLELVEGPTLADRIAKGPIPLDEALPIAKQIAEALEAAHEQGIIHRDLKPANIKVRDDGTVKVLDFGLAKAMEPASAMSPAMTASPTITTPAQMTGVGMILGTAAYMSPEQAKGRPADKRSDVWAFGCVLYEMLTGKRTFAGEDVSDTLANVLKSTPDWTKLPARVPANVRAILEGCLQKERRARVPEIAVLRYTIDATDAAAPRRGVNPAVLVALVLLAVAGTSSAWWWRGTAVPVSTPLVSKFTIALPPGQQFTNTGRHVVAWSPDGRKLVYVANGALYLRGIGDLEAQRIPGTEISRGSIVEPVFSPDGLSIAYWTGGDNTLKRIAVTGGVPVTLCVAERVFGMSWYAGGVVYGQPSGVMRVAAEGGQPQVLVKTEHTAFGPRVLPDGDSLLFTQATDDSAAAWDRAQVVVVSLATGDRKTLVDGGSDARYLATGHLVYAKGGLLFAVPYDLKKRQVVGGATVVLEGVRRGTGPTVAAQFDVATNGSLLFVPGAVAPGQQNALVFAESNGTMQALRLPVAPYATPRLSPDGTQLAVTIDDGRAADIWMFDVTGATAGRRLTFAGRNRLPVFSPDGRRLAYQSDREGDAAIFVQTIDGAGSTERLTRAAADTVHVPDSWSPNGEWLLYDVAAVGKVSLWALSLKNKTSAAFGGAQSTGPTNATFSPDGRWVAYGSVVASASTVEGIRQVSGVYVQTFPASDFKFQISSPAVTHPVWLSNPLRLSMYAPYGALTFQVTPQPAFTLGTPSVGPVMVADNGPGGIRSWDATRDGSRVLGLSTGTGDATTPELRVVLNWFEELKQRVPSK